MKKHSKAKVFRRTQCKVHLNNAMEVVILNEKYMRDAVFKENNSFAVNFVEYA